MFQLLPVPLPSLVKTFFCRAFSCLVYSQCKVGKLTKSLSLEYLKKKKKDQRIRKMTRFWVSWYPNNFFLMCMVLMIYLAFCLSDTSELLLLHFLPCPDSFMINCHRTDGLTSVWLYLKSMPCTNSCMCIRC